MKGSSLNKLFKDIKQLICCFCFCLSYTLSVLSIIHWSYSWTISWTKISFQCHNCRNFLFNIWCLLYFIKLHCS